MEPLDLLGVRISFDPDYPDKVEIELIEDGAAVEGGQFDLGQFIDHVMAFYHQHY